MSVFAVLQFLMEATSLNIELKRAVVLLSFMNRDRRHLNDKTTRIVWNRFSSK